MKKMENNKQIPDFVSFADNIRRDAARMAASQAKIFFKENFARGGFQDEPFAPWRESGSPFARKLMYNKGNLMHSIRTLEQSETIVITGSTSPYASIHNQGGSFVVTAKMKAFWWAKYYELAGKVKQTKRGGIAASSRKVGAKAEFCRRMALQKVGSVIKIPKRQFIGESKVLMKQFDAWLITEIETREIKQNGVLD